MEFNFEEALGDTIKEKMETLHIFLHEQKMEGPLLFGKWIRGFLEVFGRPDCLDRFGSYKVQIDFGIEPNEIVDKNNKKVTVTKPKRTKKLYSKWKELMDELSELNEQSDNMFRYAEEIVDELVDMGYSPYDMET
jgi:hypothetical protein